MGGIGRTEESVDHEAIPILFSYKTKKLGLTN